MSIFSMKKRKFYTAVSLCAAVFSLCLIPAAFGSGTIETVAGTGDGTNTEGTNLNDGGPAVDATLNSPVDVFVDDTGFYIADSKNNRIRRVNLSDGIISTVAGNGASGYTEMVYEGKAATSAALSSSLYGVAASGGTFYIADAYNKRVFKVESGDIFTLENVGKALLDIVNYNGFLYISNSDIPIVQKIEIATKTVSDFAGDGKWGTSGDGGPATLAALGTISALAVDSDGNIYLADSYYHRIRKVATDGNIYLVAGGTSGFSGDGGLATSAKLKSPQGVAVDAAGNVYISDTGNNRIRKVNISGYISTVAGDGTAGFLGDGGDATTARLNGPKGLSVDSSGNLYIADNYNNRIRKVTFPPDSPPEKGDLNADGTVGLADAIAGLKVLAGIGSADVRADVDGDGKISMGDVIAILKYVLDGTPL